MLNGTRVRVTRDCINKSTGEVWIKRGSKGTLKMTFKDKEEFCCEVLLDDGRRIIFRSENITLERKCRIC